MYNLDTKRPRVPRNAVLVYGQAQRELNRRSDAVRNIQLFGKVRYQDLETPVFNKLQQRIYAEAVYGLSTYTEAELARMSGKRRHEIIMLFKRTQNTLNEWKVQIIENKVIGFLNKLFPRSSTVRVFNSITGTEGAGKCKLTFKELGINQKMIAEKLVSAGILPENFFQLA